MIHRIIHFNIIGYKFKNFNFKKGNIKVRYNIVKDAEKILKESSYLVKRPYEHKNKWKNLFGNNNKICLELGMGRGSFIIKMAEMHPNINFIGLEKFDSVIVQAVEKIYPLELNNIKLINADAEELLDMFEENEISKIFLNFSDPWPKNRHEKRRLSHANFLNRYNVILNGDIEMKTDNRELFEFSLISFNQNKWDFLELSLDLHHRNEDEYIITTEYEERFTKKGNVIYYIRTSKKEG